MSRNGIADELKECLRSLTQKEVEAGLRPLLPPDELPGLVLKIRAALSRIVEGLQ